MSENKTQEQNGARSFEERVIALLNELRDRVTAIEAKSYDTKPIWERALAEITETRREMSELRSEMDGLRGEVNELRGEMNGLRAEVSEMRGEVNSLRRDVDEMKIVMERGFRGVERKLDVFNQDLLDLRDSYRRLEDGLQAQR